MKWGLIILQPPQSFLSSMEQYVRDAPRQSPFVRRYSVVLGHLKFYSLGLNSVWNMRIIKIYNMQVSTYPSLLRIIKLIK